MILKPVYDLLLFLGCILKFDELYFDFEKQSLDKIKKFIKTLLYPITLVLRRTCYNKGKTLLPLTLLYVGCAVLLNSTFSDE